MILRKMMNSQITYRVVGAFALAICIGLTGCPTEESKPTYRVGLVTDTGRVDDGTFNEYAYEGAVRAAKDFDLQFDYRESIGQGDYEPFMTDFAASGYDHIIGVGFLMEVAAHTVAQTYPNTKVSLVDMPGVDGLDNFLGLTFREEQAAYLAGMLAGSMTESQNVGVVAGMAIPPVKRFVHGYLKGVQAVCADCTLTCTYVNDFGRSDTGAVVAGNFLTAGVDVIFGAGGATGAGAVAHAAAEGAWVIGVDQDEYYTTFEGGERNGVDRLLSSAIKRVDVAVYDAIAAAVNGAFTAGTLVLSAENNGIGLAPFHAADSSIPDAVKTTLESTFQELAAKTIYLGIDLDSGEMINAADTPACNTVDSDGNPVE